MRLTFNAPVVLGYVMLCAAVLLAAEFVSPLTLWYVSLPPSPDLSDPATWLRLVTHVAGHADFDHFAANAVYLLLLGPMVEARYGSLTLLACLLATAAATGLAAALLTGSGILGASGVVFMLIAMSSVTSLRRGDIPLTFVLVTAIFLWRELAEASPGDGVSHLGHLVGGGCGAALAFFLAPRGDGGRKVAS